MSPIAALFTSRPGRGTTAALLALGVLACGPDPDAGAPTTEAGPARAPARNVILLSLDTLRADHLGLYGYERDTSPHLDALGRRSVVFEEAIAQASSTLPSHASLFQSRLASHTGDEQPALAEVLAAAGFRTAAFTAGGNVSAQLGFGRGFERYEETPGNFAAGWDAMESWLRDAPSDEPFFLFLHTYDVHLPYAPVEPWDTHWAPEYDGKLHGRNHANHLRVLVDIPVPDTYQPYALDAADREKIVALYDGEIAVMDGYVGRLVALLDELALAEDTLLVVLSDHGEEFWDHGKVLHGHTIHRELVRVPLLLRLPGERFAGRRVGEPVRLLDVAPTVLELLGVETPDAFGGRSLLPLLRGDALPPVPIVTETAGWAAITEGPWKLMVSGRLLADGANARLYDLRTDRDEHDDVAEAHPQVVARLYATLVDVLATDPTRNLRTDGTDVADEELRKQLEQLGYVGER